MRLTEDPSKAFKAFKAACDNLMFRFKNAKWSTQYTENASLFGSLK